MLFERPAAGHRALLVHVRFGAGEETDRMNELAELAHSAGMQVVGQLYARRTAPHPRWFIGDGKAQELCDMAAAAAADVVIINHELSPGQQRNLERRLERGLLTRTELILNIFADRARSHEGQLQVELARCRHAQTRLVRGWTHLDRQKGGVGLRGAGEKQLELDQRMLDERIRSIQKKLDRVRARRAQGRRRRQRSQLATVVLVGYTNAGKSTLFNALTRGGAHAEDRLFATLDPTMRQLDLPGVGRAVLADTVGFVRDLPHSLVDAFKATLEEVRDADLLLQVVDAADSQAGEHSAQVAKVLAELGAEAVPLLKVYNKIDLVGDGRCPIDDGVGVSAVDGTGLARLRARVAEALVAGAGCRFNNLRIELTPAQGKLRAWLHDRDAVCEEQGIDSGGWQLLVRLDAAGERRLHEERVALVAGGNGGS